MRKKKELLFRCHRERMKSFRWTNVFFLFCYFFFLWMEVQARADWWVRNNEQPNEIPVRPTTTTFRFFFVLRIVLSFRLFFVRHLFFFPLTRVCLHRPVTWFDGLFTIMESLVRFWFFFVTCTTSFFFFALAPSRMSFDWPQMIPNRCTSRWEFLGFLVLVLIDILFSHSTALSKRPSRSNYCWFP